MVGLGGSGVVSFVPARLGNVGQGKAVSVCSGLAALGEAVMVGQYQSSSGVFGSDMVRRLWLGTALQVSARCGSARQSGHGLLGLMSSGGVWQGGLGVMRHGKAGHGWAR